VGRLTPIEPIGVVKDKKRTWRCICDCGKEFNATASELKRNAIQSCGCVLREIVSKRIVEESKKNFVDGTNIAAIAKNTVRKDSTTGVRGVAMRENGRYRAYITFKRKRYNLGSFETIEEAAAARKEAVENKYESFLESYRNENEND